MPKNIVICCDGTTNQISGDHTNVMKLWCALDRNPANQVVYYDPGVGTMGDSRMWTRLGRTITRILDAAIGRKVGENVGEAYAFLMHNYEPGDQIYMFGFSRGAYTVRALAGLIYMFGLANLSAENLSYLWLIYSGEDDTERRPGERFAVGRWFRHYTRSVPIHFIGVWDTVSSKGWFFVLDSLPHTALNPSIAHIRHAVSLDERRAAFRQNLFRPESDGNHDVKEVWFPGVHCDVGGGYEERESGLSKIALEWMFREAEACELKIDQDAKVAILGGDGRYAPADSGAKAHQSLIRGWRIMEFLPRRRWLRTDGKYHWGMNLFQRRVIPPDAILHKSVVERCAKMQGYDPGVTVAKHRIEK